ncbi:MAG: DNA-formamidopyrimidine glycosylase family protein [Baekduia sp.]
MPEGDTIHHAALRIRAVLPAGTVPDEVATPHARFGRDRWPERLAGLPVDEVSAHGKHLFIRFGDELTIHSHLRMTGAWHVYADGERWRRSPRRAWLTLRRGEQTVVQFDGPLLELLTESRRRFDRRLAALGPDILGEQFDPEAVIARLRTDDPTRPFGDALLDQRNVAGIGNIWKSESCFGAGVDPWRRLGEISGEEVVAVLENARPRMQRSALTGRHDRDIAIYGRDGRVCSRCGSDRVRARGQGDANRMTYWCPTCQR